MATPARNSFPFRATAGAIAAMLASLLASCASMPRENPALGLERKASPFSNGRVTVVLVDEYGIALPGMTVDMAWEEPSFYKTSALTNRQGEVSFSGVPEVAEVVITHPGGREVRTLLVPQSGRPELRMVLDTMGGGAAMRERERELMQPRAPQPQPGGQR